MNIESNANLTHGVSSPVRWAIFIALALLALAVRLPQLGQRPMHTDESINAYITGDLLAGGSFHYDPHDRHGPALFVIAEPLARLLGARNFSDLTEAELRLTPVIVGSATVLLFGAGVGMFGFIPCLVAALLFAFAPLPVYYNRYFIHETLFVAATLGFILAGGRALGWGLAQNASAPNNLGTNDHLKGNSTMMSAVLAGLCAALMLACKETAVIHFFALAVVMLCARLLPPREKFPAAKMVAIALVVLIFISTLLFTWFGRNWSVFSDLLQAIPRFAARAGGEGHEKPFGYYFHLVDPMMVLTIVAVAGGYAAICDAVNRTRKTHLLMVIYGLVIFLVYSSIPYKTPWLALNLWLPLALVVGFGVAGFWEQIKSSAGRWLVSIGGAFFLMTLAAQTKLFAFDQPADEKNPYAYAHTGEDLLGLTPRLEQLAGERHLTQPRIAVVAADPWPLPWYLRKFSHVGYWQPGQETGPADFFITITDVSGPLAVRLKDFREEFFGVRPGVLVMLWTPIPQKSTP